MMILIKNASIIPQNEKRQTVKNDIYIEDDKISQIAPSIKVEAEYVIDGEKKLVLPGLINTHTHLPMTLMRGYGDELSLEKWLNECIWPIEARLDKKFVEAGAKLSLLEMISTGTTCFTDMYFFEDLLATVAKKVGIRAFMGFAIIDFDTPEMPKEMLLSECEKFCRKWINDDLITPVVAPHSTYSCSPEKFQKASEMAQNYGVLLHTHCSETRKEVYNVKKRYGMRPVEHLKKLGILNENTLLAHCGWITKGEIKEIATTGARVSYNPVSNMKLATGGYAPIPELLQAGVPVGLGTDGAASNNSLDMFESMKFAALLQKQHRWDPSIISAQTVLDMATIGGANCLGINAGSIEEGKKADLIMIEMDKPNMIPRHNLISNLVYSVKGCDVSTTIVNGKLLMLEREFLTLDYEKVLEDAEEAARELVSKI